MSLCWWTKAVELRYVQGRSWGCGGCQRISLAINFCLCSIYLLHSMEQALCRVMLCTLAMGKGYLLPAQWVNRGMSFPKEAIQKPFLYLLSHVQEFLEKWMITDRFQDFFYFSKLQRHWKFLQPCWFPDWEIWDHQATTSQPLLCARC